MTKLFAEALKIRNLFGVAIFSLILIYLFKNNINTLAIAGDSDNLNLLLAFLFFIIIGVLGITAYYAIAEKEIEKENKEVDKGHAIVKGSPKADTTILGGGKAEVTDSEGAKTRIENPGIASDSEKKT